MSFGFGVGDFLAVGKLSIHLWRSIKDAPGEFAEVSRELSSINIVIADLTDQAGSPTSLLNRRGASRKEELMVLCDNLMGTLQELRAVHQKYRNMGRNAWLRVQLGEQDLVALRSKLSLHLGLIDAFVSSLTMASVGSMEPMMVEVLRILRNAARGHGMGAKSLLSVQAPDARDDEWEVLERELQSEGVPIDFVQSRKDDIRTLVHEIVDEEALNLAEDIQPGDSVSQTERLSVGSSSNQTSIKVYNDHGLRSYQIRRPRARNPSSVNDWLGGASKRDIQAARIRIMNYGYDLDEITQTTWWKRLFEGPFGRLYGERALCEAASRCDILAVRLVLDQCVYINVKPDGKTPILCAIESTYSDEKTAAMVKQLLQMGGNCNLLSDKTDNYSVDDNRPPVCACNLYEAARLGKEWTVRILIDQGAHVSWKSNTGLTPLHAAAGNHHDPIVELLLERGAFVNAVWRYGRAGGILRYTPLDCCRRVGGQDSRTSEILIAAGGVAVTIMH